MNQDSVNENQTSLGERDESPRPALEGSRIVRSKDVMTALSALFTSLRGQKLSVADVGIRVYQQLSTVPEFTLQNQENDYVAWCRYRYDESGSIRDIVTCDSDAKGAFKVWRTPEFLNLSLPMKETK
jgi:hypothetical protein